MKALCIGVSVFLVSIASHASAQSIAGELEFVQADAGDVASIDALVDAYYGSLSGEAGDRREHKRRYASLFATMAQIITPTLRNEQGESIPNARPIADWMTRYPDERDNSFYEWEVARRTEQFDHMAHVYSTYEIRDRKTDTEPRRRGVTSFNLSYIDGRWWIVTLQWSGRPADEPFPERYRPRKR